MQFFRFWIAFSLLAPFLSQNVRSAGGCEFSDCVLDHTFLRGLACNAPVRTTRSQAMDDCCRCAACNGITEHNNAGVLEYSAREGPVFISFCGEKSMLRVLQRGSSSIIE